jgi:hypothetical protein
MREFRLRWLGLALGLGLLAVAACSGRNWAARRPLLRGTYLVAGGTDYMKFAPDPKAADPETPPVVIADGTGLDLNASTKSAWTWKIKPAGRGYDVERWVDDVQPSGRTKTPYGEAFSIVPSMATPGDWDLESYGIGYTATPKMFPVLSSVPGYLHRVDDPRVEAFFKAKPDERLAIVEPLARERPDDPATRLLYWRALYQKDATKPLLEDLARWKDRCENSPAPFIRNNYNRALAMAQAKADALAWRNGAPKVERLFGGKLSLGQFLKEFSTLPQLDEIKIFPSDLCGAGFSFSMGVSPLGHTALTASELYLFTGQRKEALDLAVANVYMGQEMSQFGATIVRLIGLSQRDIGIKGLELYGLNACQTPQDYMALWERLAWLDKRTRTIAPDELFSFAPVHWMPTEDCRRILRLQEQVYYLWQVTSVEARWRNLLVGVAARARLASTGAFPRNEKEFAPWLATLPADPFTSAPLRYFSTPDAFTVYSVGPDRKDDRATLAYDPTNGTVSSGDIILDVPAKPRYPFPPGGVRASSAEDVRRAFPNGLPPDPFGYVDPSGHYLRNQPLKIADGRPVRVYSVGLDEKPGDGWGSNDPSLRVPIHPAEISYDPTNGLVSPGDIFVSLQPLR